MVSWWPADGDARDIVGGNHGTLLNGTTFTPGHVGEAFSFDGVNDFVSFGATAGNFGADDFTIEFWIRKPTSTLEGVIGKRPICGPPTMWDIIAFTIDPAFSRPASIVIHVFQTLSVSDSVAASGIGDGNFHHVAFARKGNALRAYRDGVLEAETITPSIANTSSGAELIAGKSTCTGFDGTSFLTGELDEITIYNRALGDAEIRAIFEAGSAGKRKPVVIEPPGGMVSWWPGDGNASDIVDGNHGILSGDTTFTGGIVGQAFSFDGTGDFVLVADNPNLNITGDVTVDLWAKRNGTGTGNLVSKGAGAIGGVDVPSAYEIRFNADNRVRALFERANGSNVQLIGPTPTDTAFHHYAYVRGGDNHKLFIDGVVVAAAAFTGTPGDTSGIPLVIGAVRNDSDPTGFSGHFAGIIDEVEVFNRALSDAEIRAIFEARREGKIKPAGITPPTGMVSWWPGDGNASDIVDGNSGTLENGATFALGKVKEAFSLDGVDDHVEIGTGADFETAHVTVEAWLKPSQASVDAGFFDHLVTKRSCCEFPPFNDPTTFQWSLQTVDAPYRYWFGLSVGDVLFSVVDSQAATTDWAHVVATYDGETVKLYVNGALKGQNTAPSGNIDSRPGVPVVVGARMANNFGPGRVDPFGGLVDEFTIYNRALNAAEIKAIFDAGSAGKRKP